MKLNKDVVGWIKIFDTHISYPVVQGKDNQEYLNKDVFGEFSFSGSIFLDYRNACDFTDSYSIIYGHHMEYGAMFGDVVEFKNDDYFQKHKTGALFLLDDTYKITLFACVETQEFNNKIYNPIVQGKDNLDTLLKYIKDEAVQYRDISLNHDDKIIGLSTCTYEIDNCRSVVVARKLRKGESEDVNTSKAYLKNDVLYPDDWYSKYGGKMPVVNSFTEDISEHTLDWYDGKRKQ